MKTTATRTVTVTNPQGLHLRPCSAIIDTVRKYRAHVVVHKDNRSTSATSLLGLLSLASPSGTKLVLSATGAEAEQALDAVASLFREEFATAYA